MLPTAADEVTHVALGESRWGPTTIHEKVERYTYGKQEALLDLSFVSARPRSALLTLRFRIVRLAKDVAQLLALFLITRGRTRSGTRSPGSDEMTDPIEVAI